MADRILNEASTVWMDVPGATATGDYTLTDPIGDVSSLGTGISPSEGRYSVSLPAQTIPGLYLLTLTVSGTSYQRRFTVGTRNAAGRTRYDIRADAAHRLGMVHIGLVDDADTESVSDVSLYGGASEYVSWWIVFGPDSANPGRSRMISDYNGATLQWADALPTSPVAGDQFTLFQAQPAEIDRALEVAVRDMAELSRIPVTLELAVASDAVTVPQLVTHIHQLYEDDTLLTNSAWDTLPGRRVYYETDELTLTVRGSRESWPPQWDDSLLDLPPAPIIARVAMQLHFNRARGNSSDLDEHLRRGMVAQDEWEQARRIVSGRIPSGSRLVLD